MKFNDRSNNLLTHTIAKAKYVEFGVGENDLPAGLKNANDLLYSTIHVLSCFSQNLIYGKTNENVNNELEFVSAYYENFIESEQEDISYIWILLGACSNIFSNNFGNAKALMIKLKNLDDCHNVVSLTTLNYLNIILNSKRMDETKGNIELLNYLEKEINGETFDKSIINNIFLKAKNDIKSNDAESNVLFGILCALQKKISNSLAVELVPFYSNSTKEIWKPYFTNSKSIKILWQAQLLIIKKEILLGQDSLIQLPTGTGKTKCVELIISAAVLTRKINTVIYVAPLKAICNEVSKELFSSLSSILSIDEISEVIQADKIFDSNKKQLLICTPEKLSFLIKNNKEIIQNCGLIIFDEAHMFDEGSRGVNYELLVTKVKGILSKQSQKIFISAVLPNAGSINNWTNDGHGVLITDDLIKKTDKNVAFYSKFLDKIIFRMKDGDNKNISILNPIKNTEVVLAKYLINTSQHNKDDVRDFFPKKDNSNDVAISLAFKLSLKSGVAIYSNTPKQVRSLFNRMIQLVGKEALPKIDYNPNEMEKLANLISAHYGECEFSKISKYGIVPHFGDLPNGIRLAVEQAIKKNDASLIICTSTLAEGVNLPIRYLIMTSFTNTFQEILSYRKFKNLFGRTARSGTYTEGSLICSDPRVFDERNAKSIKHFQWKKIIDLINDNNTDICGSSILSICNNLLYGYKKEDGFDGINTILKPIISMYADNVDLGMAVDKLFAFVKKEHKPSNKLWEMKFIDKKNQILSAISIIESFVVDHIIEIEESISINEASQIGKAIFEKTLACHLANDEQKLALTSLFIAITQKVIKLPSEKRVLFSRCVLGIDELNEILNYLELNKKELFFSDVINEDTWINCILNLSAKRYMKNRNFNNLSFEVKKELLLQWIKGKSFYEIANVTQIKEQFDIEKIEKACGNTISFETAMVFSSIITLSENLCNKKNIIKQLNFLQKRIQYGLMFAEDIFAYEIGFADRVIAQIIGEFLRENNLFEGTIHSIINNKSDIAKLLSIFPSYFVQELESLCSN